MARRARRDSSSCTSSGSLLSRSLACYHHEHPTPTETPANSSSHSRAPSGAVPRVADVVRGVGRAGVRRHDIPGGPAAKRSPRETKLSCRRRLRYELTFDAKGAPLRVGEVVKGRIAVTDAQGKPFRGLEPIMGAYAHLVGFAEDYKTVVHLHPMGDEPKKPTDRGGPVFEFRFYPPVAGFIRFYSQVSVGGSSKFAVGVTIDRPRASPLKQASERLFWWG